MKDHKYDDLNKYDNPIPKPPDEIFDDFLRNMEARLVTRRFDVPERRTIRPMTSRSEPR